MDIKFTKFKKGENWVDGLVNDGEFTFNSKLFDGGSQYGINDGRVSKLTIVETSKVKDSSWFSGCIVNYDRGWDIQPKAEHKEVYEEILNFLENAPTTRF